MAWNELKRNYKIEVQETLVENDMEWVSLMFVRYLLSLPSFTFVSLHCYRAIYDLPCINSPPNASRPNELGDLCANLSVILFLL